MFEPLFLMLKLLAPMLEKFWLMADFIPSMAVSMPTSAMMPMEMMSAVMVARSIFPRMERNATPIFSVRVTPQITTPRGFQNCRTKNSAVLAEYYGVWTLKYPRMLRPEASIPDLHPPAFLCGKVFLLGDHFAARVYLDVIRGKTVDDEFPLHSRSTLR